MKLRRIMAIFIKELQDIKKNTNVVYMYFIPIILTLLWENLVPGMPGGMGLGFGLMFLVVLVGMYVPSMLIAEEKEKKTMEILMLSPAKSTEVFIGKGLLTFISILIVGSGLIVITGSYSYSGVILTGMIMTSVFSIFLGMIVGLLAPNQMATGLIGTPIYLVLMLVPNLAVMDIEIMEKIGRFLPTYYFFEMMGLAMMEERSLNSMQLHLGVLAASIVISFLVLTIIYKKKGLIA